MKCSKAIIAAGGYGTRRLPITKVINKSLLPIGNRPVVDYVVEDCVKAGIEQIYLVVNDPAQFKQYYERSPALEHYLEESGKTELLDAVKPPQGVTFHYVKQDTSTGKYGTAIPPWLCRQYVDEGEHVLLVNGDDFVYRRDSGSSAQELLAAIEGGAEAAMLGLAVEQGQLPNYGVIAPKNGVSQLEFDHIQEKPTVEDAKSNLINLNRFLLPADFWRQLEEVVAGHPNASGEYFLTDAINNYVAEGHALNVVRAHGEYLDSGTTSNWLRANRVVIDNDTR